MDIKVTSEAYNGSSKSYSLSANMRFAKRLQGKTRVGRLVNPYLKEWQEGIECFETMRRS